MFSFHRQVEKTGNVPCLRLHLLLFTVSHDDVWLDAVDFSEFVIGHGGRGVMSSSVRIPGPGSVVPSHGD